MKVICKETCTVPGRGFIAEREAYEVDALSLDKYPFLKHFTDADGNDIKPAKEKPAKEEGGDSFPKHLGGTAWELSDGTKVNGKKEDAINAEKSLAASA